MYSIVSTGLSCDKCRDIVRLMEKISELETPIQTLIEVTGRSARALDTDLDATSLVNCTLFGFVLSRARVEGKLGDGEVL